MIENENIQFIPGVDLVQQSEAFQKWFAENAQPNITFADTCTKRDEYSRPSEWHFDGFIVKAIYFTENENYTFNKFVIYGTI